jgi:hypothetical protein
MVSSRIAGSRRPQREAILLVAGSKTGRWRDWYTKNVPIADARLDRHLNDMKGRR